MANSVLNKFVLQLNYQVLNHPKTLLKQKVLICNFIKKNFNTKESVLGT